MFPFAFCFCLVLFGVWVVGVCFLLCLCWFFDLELAPLCSDFAPLLNSKEGHSECICVIRSSARQGATTWREPQRRRTEKSKTRKPKLQNPAKKTLTETAPMEPATYVPMNDEILHRNKGTSPDYTARSCEGVQKNNPHSSAETQDPPCQDPGDRDEKPSGHHLRMKGNHGMN